MRTRILGVCLLLLAAMNALADGPAYTIRLKTYPDKGQNILCRETDKQAGLLRFRDPKGQVLEEQKPVEEIEEVYTLTVLETNGKFPTRYRESFTKAIRNDGQRTQASGYQGLVLGFEFEEGKYRLKVPEKADLTERERLGLAARANSDLEAPLDDIFQPGQPVEVGQKWDIDAKLLARAFGQNAKVDAELTKGTAKLAKVYTREDKQFGVIEIDLTVAYRAMENLEFMPPALFLLKGTLDTAIDGSSPAGTLSVNTRLLGRTQVEQKGVKLLLEISRDSNSVKERSLVR